ncbi:Uncharacterized protein BP5553_02066 [Venustampulla echinocandica]|uniref:Uncharacterized protein n=1 Tax=Venustampulla echinocandica TaxID=2656787 RepID=A0A370U2S6_9HELO|nr:Uncharacterized protein BP5553_02066 [Venustampulla echinocandica]RDL42087.1 Uncharacterized protein BP5553_02066 [Venustampulla echinocandica]
MESRSPVYAHKETRLDLDSSTQGSTVAIRIPSHGTSTWPSRTAQKRSHVVEIPIAEDEEIFRQRHLATAASVYHRAYHRSPRSFLWRILEGGKVLSIRAVDVSKQSNAPDANLTLRLSFPSPIVPACVAFSDSREHDVLSAFVLTESNHLFTLTLRPDFFRRALSTEGNVGDWCKSYLSSAFSFKHPYRLVALTADELLVSLIDGGLLKLSRKSGGDGAEWKEIFYNEGGWSNSLRSLIPFHGSNTVRYGKHNIELSAVTSIASPVSHIDGMPYAFTISLDHRLRIWNLMTGKVAYMGDMLGQELDPQETVKKAIDPSLSRLIKVSSYGEGALCVTYSPLGTGEFKFWTALPRDDGTLELTDLFPRHELKPRTPTPDLWTLADFSVVLDRTNIESFSIWTLWKNNTTYRVQNLKFERGSTTRVNDAWASEWTAMATEALHETPNPVVYSGDPLDITDKWLEFIMSPGRFSTATIETGLALCENLSKSKNAARKSESLPERMCSIVASSDSLKPKSDGNMDYETLQGDVQNHWLRFYRLLIELDKLRGEAQSLVIDPHGDMPWVILADGLTAIRYCSKVEEIWHNTDIPRSGTEHVAGPLVAAAEFRGSFSEQLLYSCKTMLFGELFEEQSLTSPAMMLEFYDKCDFYNRIRADDITRLEEGLGGGYKNVTPEVYEQMLGNLVAALEDSDKRPQVLPLAEFGNKLIIKGVQEIVELHSAICLDQIVLLVYIEAEINHDEKGIQFDTAAIFHQFLTMLKRLELVKWLVTTRISLPLAKAERSNSIVENTAKKQVASMENITVLEGVLRHLFGLDLRPKESMSSALTEIILQICAPNSEYELSPSVIQCFLLRHDRADLAMEFSRFTAHDPFSTYIKGRACLASNDPQTAALLFKKAAFGISAPNPKQRSALRSAGYLDDTERNSLNAGLPEYYAHIVYLYDKDKIFSFAIDFARLALQFLKPESDDFDRRELRTEMHSRLFNSAIQTARFELAHSTLSLLTDHALQQSSLRILVTKMCETSYASELVEFPFIGLQDAVDEILAQKCHSIVDVTVGVPYHKILYAWRIRRSDFRGAATISLERLQKLQQSGEGDRALGEDSLETPVTKQYVALINALSCVDPKQAWILSEEIPRRGVGSKNGATPKRSVVTLDDIRKEYQGELDRIAAIENNQFALAGGDEMDVL